MVWRTRERLWAKLKPHARAMRTGPTGAEAMLWKYLRKRRLAGLKFRRQHAIDRYVVDFYCPGARLVVEVDGAMHDPGADAVRDDRLRALGLGVLRFVNDEVERNPGAVLQRIRQAVEAGRVR